MIKRILCERELGALPLTGVEPQKIRALCRAYGFEYDFCRVYAQGERAFLSLLDGSAVLWAAQGADFGELADFLRMNGFSELFCGGEAARELSARLGLAPRQALLMRFDGRTQEFPVDYSPQLSDVYAIVGQALLMRFDGRTQEFPVDYSPQLSDVYAIVGQAFGMEFEPWYLDLSHRIRHGVSTAALAGRSALVIQHRANGEALLSQVATDPRYTGQGSASKLILGVCAALSPDRVFVLCERRLEGFYARLGFTVQDVKYILNR